MKVSILIPTFNRAEFLKQALESIAGQTFKDWEVCIYDDGSTDNTSKVATDFLENHMGKYERGTVNKGVGYARNRLFEMAEGEILAWQDSDDISHPHRLEQMVKALEEQKADIIFSEMYFFLHPNKHTQTRTIHRIDISKYTDRGGLHNNTNFATAVFKSDLKEFKFNAEMRRREDAEWLTQLMNAHKTFGYYRKPLYYCRRHPGRLTNGHRFPAK